MFSIENYKKSHKAVGRKLESAYEYNLSNRLVCCAPDILRNHICARLHVYDLNRLFRTCIAITTLGFKVTYLSQRKVEMGDKKRNIINLIEYIMEMHELSQLQLLDKKIWKIFILCQYYLCFSSVLKSEKYIFVQYIFEGLLIFFNNKDAWMHPAIIYILQEISLIDELEVKKQFIHFLMNINQLGIDKNNFDLLKDFLISLGYSLNDDNFYRDQLENLDRISEMNMEDKSRKLRCLVSLSKFKFLM